MSPLPLLAWRLLYALKGEFLLHAATLAIGVAMLTGVAATHAHLKQGLEVRATTLMAADLRLHSAEPLDDFMDKELQGIGVTISKIKEFRATAVTGGESRPVLVEVKAVDGAYPLRGEVKLAGGIPLAAALADGGAAVEAALLHRLDISLGTPLQLGEATFTPRAILEQEPDRATALFSLGPRIIIPLDRAEETGLLRHGSRIRHIAGLKLAHPEMAATLGQRLKQRPGAKNIRIDSPLENQPALRRFMDRAFTFLAMTSVLALLTGAAGMAAGARAHLERQRRNVAILKAMGATGAQVLRIFGWQALILSGVGSGAGALLGLLLPPLLLLPFSDLMGGIPYQPPWIITLLGMAGGLGLGFLFLLAPLLGLRATPAVALLRSVSWEETPPSNRSRWILYPLVLLLIGGLAAHWGDRRIALACTGGLLGVLLLARLGLWGIFHLLRHLPTRGFSLRWILRGITTSGGMTAALPLTTALTLMMTLLLLERNLNQQFVGPLREKAPSFFFIDLQSAQTGPFRELLERHGGRDLRLYPTVRGRLSALREQSVDEMERAHHPEAWRFNRSYVLTWSEALPPGNTVVAGSWPPPPGAAGVTLEEQMAADLGLGVGDPITFDIQGIPVTAPVTAIRQLRWSDMGLNFFAIFSPASLGKAPATWLASAVLPRAREESASRAVARAFPNVTTLPSRQVLEMAREMLDKLTHAIALVGWGAALAGWMAVVASTLAGRRRRVQAHGVLRLLGAERHRLLGLAVGEHLLLGAVTSTLALILAQGSTALLLWKFLGEIWSWQPTWSLVAWMGGTLAILLAGVLAAVGETQPSPVVILRQPH